MFKRVEGARLLAYRAARLCEQGIDHRGETAMAKFSAAEALIEAVTVANRILGGYSANLDYARLLQARHRHRVDT